jgi:hypothetical protein
MLSGATAHIGRRTDIVVIHHKRPPARRHHPTRRTPMQVSATPTAASRPK